MENNLIELKTEKASTSELDGYETPIPDEVKNNFITQQEEKEEKEKKEEKNYAISSQRDSDIIIIDFTPFKFFVVLFLFFANFLPFPLAFSEAILRSVINYSYKPSLSAQIFFYFFLLTIFIIFSEVSDKNCRTNIIFGSIGLFSFAMLIILIVEIVQYYKNIDEINEMRDFIKILIKFRIFSYYIAAGTDILFLITYSYIFKGDKI